MPAELPTLLTQGGDTSDLSTYTTSSVSPSSGKFQLLAVCAEYSLGGGNVPSISGCNLTWTLVDRIPTALAVSNNNLFLYRATGSPSNGTISIDFSGQTQRNCVWILIEIGSVDLGGINGANAIIQHVPQDDGLTGNTSMNITLGAFSNVANPTLGVIAVMDKSNTAITPGNGFTEIGQVLSDDPVPDVDLRLEWQAKITNDTTVDWTFVNTTLNRVVGIALELNFKTGGSGGGGQSQGKGTGGGASGGGGNAFGKGKDKDHGKDKGGGNGPPGTIDKILVGSRSRRRIGTL